MIPETIKDCYRKHFNLPTLYNFASRAIPGHSSGYIGWDIFRDTYGTGYRNTNRIKLKDLLGIRCEKN